jgi:hypothetical protein
MLSFHPTENFPRVTLTCNFQLDFEVVWFYQKLCRQQAEAIKALKNENIRNSTQGEAQNRFFNLIFPVVFMYIKRRKWGPSKTQLSWFCIYCGDSDCMFRPCLVIFRSQVDVMHKWEKTQLYVYRPYIMDKEISLLQSIVSAMSLNGGWFWIWGPRSARWWMFRAVL